MANNSSTSNSDQRRAELDEKQLQELQKDAFSLANYYFVFQGVIFTAFFSGSSSLKCHFRWLPLLLSSLAGVLNLSALVVIALRYKSLLDWKDDELISRLVPPSSSGSSSANSNSNSNSNPDLNNNKAPPTATRTHSTLVVIKYEKRKRMMFIVACMVIFVAFFIATIVGCLTVPCRSVELYTVSGSNRNCVNFCDSDSCITICQK